jgi:hypothetical protein
MSVPAGFSVSGRTTKKGLHTHRYVIMVTKFWLGGKNAVGSVSLVTDASTEITLGSIRKILWELNLLLYAELRVNPVYKILDFI